jgi:hypothetical protein
MIELIIGSAVVGAGVVWAGVAMHFEQQRARLAFATERGLRKDKKQKHFSGRVSGAEVQLLFRLQSNGKSATAITEMWFNTGASSLVVKETPLLDRAGITDSEDFVTGDVAFDKAFLVQGLPLEIAFALGEKERERLLALKLRGEATLEQGTLFVKLSTHDLKKVGHTFELCAALAGHLASQQQTRTVVLLARMNDPLAPMRAVAQLAQAELSKREEDILAVNTADLDASHALRLWRLASESAPGTARSLFYKLITLQHPSLLTALLAHVPSITPAVEEHILFPLLSHADDDIRLGAATRLGQLGTVAAVPHLRALEGASLIARKQVHTAKQAIAAIHARAGSGELAGAISLGDDARGGLSKA